MKESVVESALVKAVKAEGGMAIKLVSPGTLGVPDRLVIVRGKIAMVELKAPGRKPRPSQRAMFDRLANEGMPVFVIDNPDDARDFPRFLEEDYFLEKAKRK